MDWSLLALPGLIIWLIILCLPWRPWSTRESLDVTTGNTGNFPDITVLIPARNEAAVISSTLRGLADQDQHLKIILIDDQSDDNTSEIARQCQLQNLELIKGDPLPAGWSGKLWALHQGLDHVDTKLTLLLDADIRLTPGILNELQNKLQLENLDMVSLMAQLKMQYAWEKLLLPAFIFFFKLLYPFRLSNSGSHLVAAAAGGCILVKTTCLKDINAFESLCGNLIDDCALARKLKDTGHKTWLGLTHSAISLRPYQYLAEIWDMVARTAFTQLRYSWSLLVLCTVLMSIAFVLPLVSLFISDWLAICFALLSISIMGLCYLPVINYYGLNPIWTAALPLAGILFLFMTWSSAFRHIGKTGSHWKNRHYSMNLFK